MFLKPVEAWQNEAKQLACVRVCLNASLSKLSATGVGGLDHGWLSATRPLLPSFVLNLRGA